jgi:hypothetical protein
MARSSGEIVFVLPGLNPLTGACAGAVARTSSGRGNFGEKKTARFEEKSPGFV